MKIIASVLDAKILNTCKMKSAVFSALRHLWSVPAWAAPECKRGLGIRAVLYLDEGENCERDFSTL